MLRLERDRRRLWYPIPSIVVPLSRGGLPLASGAFRRVCVALGPQKDVAFSELLSAGNSESDWSDMGGLEAQVSI